MMNYCLLFLGMLLTPLVAHGQNNIAVLDIELVSNKISIIKNIESERVRLEKAFSKIFTEVVSEFKKDVSKFNNNICPTKNEMESAKKKMLYRELKIIELELLMDSLVKSYESKSSKYLQIEIKTLVNFYKENSDKKIEVFLNAKDLLFHDKKLDITMHIMELLDSANPNDYKSNRKIFQANSITDSFQRLISEWVKSEVKIEDIPRNLTLEQIRMRAKRLNLKRAEYPNFRYLSN